MTHLISPVVVLEQVSKLFAGRRALDRVSLIEEALALLAEVKSACVAGAGLCK